MSQVAARSEIEAIWARKKNDKKEKRRRRKDERGHLTINSLMDAFFIILCFLLKSFGSDPVQIRESDDLKLPRTSEEEKGLEDAIVIAISKRSIIVQDNKVADLRGGAVDESLKRDGQDGLLINPLLDALKERVQHLKMLAARTGRPFDAMALVVADRKTSYRLLTEVLYTAGQAEFEKFKFVAAEGANYSGSPGH
jgi:biopolymer transport protein ExbD